MKNIFKSKFSVLFVVTAMAAILLLFSSCATILNIISAIVSTPRLIDHGVFDKAVPEEQMCEIRFSLVNITSFNGRPVYWGVSANNMGFVKVPAGKNTIVFDWVSSTANMVRADYDSVRGGSGYTYTVTTSGLRNIRFPDAEMLPGHKYLIGGGLNRSGRLITYLTDMTYMPSKLWGDKVPGAPRASKTATVFEGTWKNTYGESFEFVGNRFVWTIPPMARSNAGPSQLRMRGTFLSSDETITLFVTGTSVVEGVWTNIKAMRNAYIFVYSFGGSSLFLELPYVLPVAEFKK